MGGRDIWDGDYSGLRNMMQQACRVGIAGPAGVFLALTQPADNRPQSLNGYVIWRLQDFKSQGPSHNLVVRSSFKVDTWCLFAGKPLRCLNLDREPV